MVEPMNQFGIDNPIKFGNEFNDDTVITAKPIHISAQQVTVRKKATLIVGIPEDIDLKLVLRVWKKIYHCTGSIKEDPKTKDFFIVLNGDHRQEVTDFLIYEGIGTKENIKLHGADI